MVKNSTDGYILPQSLVWHEVGKCDQSDFPVEGTNILFKAKGSNRIQCGSKELLEMERKDGYPYTAIFVSNSRFVCFFERGDCFAYLPDGCEKIEYE